MEKIAFAALFSDGVMQVTGQHWNKVVTDLLAFKSMQGEFAKRRMMRFVKDVQKNGDQLIDDLGYAVIQVVKVLGGE